jgi:flagellar biosynthetic protein FlhB
VSERGQRTENATPQRLKKAREDGKFPVSKEFASAVQFCVLVALLIGTGNEWTRSLLRGLRAMIRDAFAWELTASRLCQAAVDLSSSWLFPLAFAGLAAIAASVAAQLGVTGFGLASAKLAPDFSRLDPLARLKDLPRHNLSSCGQAVLFFSLLCYVGWKVLVQYSPEFLGLPYQTLGNAFLKLGSVFARLLLSAAAIVFAWGSIDLFRQRRRYSEQLKMTKQEVKDEWRQNEGNPEIKLRIRRLRHDLLRRRMMADVPKASAVIVNPTHFAVALLYEHTAMAAPKVVAKGKNFLALRIRDLARAHQVPIIENPPLAQALYKNCEVGREIPESLYKAVAEILAYVFLLLNKNR